MLDTSLTELLAIPPESPLDTRIASHEERLRQKKIQLENSLLAAEKKFQEIRQQIIEDASRLTDFSPRQLEQAINSAREDVRVLTFTCRMLAKEKQSNEKQRN